MPKEDSRSANKPMHALGERGSIRQAILFVILLVTAVLGYLYFFTGVIKPREEVTNSPLHRIAPVKQPLPPRPDQEGTEQASPVTTTENIPAADGKEKLPQPANAAKPAAPAVTPQANPAAVTSSKQTVASNPKPASPPPAKAVVVPVQPVKPAKSAEKPASGIGAKIPSAPLPPPAKSHKGSGTRSVAVAPAKETKNSKPAAAEHQDAAKGRFALILGEFATDREAGKARLKLEKLGVTPITARRLKTTVTMHRLFLADFGNHDAAETELKKLRTHVDGAFILKENGRYAVYAGSFLHEKGAASELKRLAGKGVKLVPKTAKVALPMSQLTAGSFSDRVTAQKEADRLKKNGMAAKVLKMSK